MLRTILLALLLVLGIAVGAVLVSVGTLMLRNAIVGGGSESALIAPSVPLPDILSRLQLVPQWRRGREIVAVVIENHEDARPHQRGLESALLIQEYLVEGFISRFVALFDLRSFPAEVGPVRSLRSYFLDGVQPLARVVLHAGGSPDALERVTNGEDVYAVNGLAYEEESFRRDESVPPPHNLFISRSGLHALLPEEMPRTPWPPYRVGTSEDLVTSEPRVLTVHLSFLSPLHNVVYVYDPWFKWYRRRNGDIESTARPHNVLVLEVPVEGIGEYGRLHIPLEGGGRLLLFHSGRVYEGRWKKEGTEAPFTFLGEDAKPLTFVAGQTWMTVLPTLDRVSW